MGLELVGGCFGVILGDFGPFLAIFGHFCADLMGGGVWKELAPIGMGLDEFGVGWRRFWGDSGRSPHRPLCPGRCSFRV